MDWNNPLLTQTHVSILDDLKNRDVDALTLAESPTNPPTGALRYVRASNKFQEWNGTTWVDKIISIAGGGTGGDSAANARTSLGIGSLGVQNSNAISVSGGAISGLASLGVSGNATISGQIIAGSTPTTITDSAGKVLETAIADGALLARNAGNETITGTWVFSNLITGTITSVANGMYVNNVQSVTGQKLFSGAQSGTIATAANDTGGIVIAGPGGANAAYMSFYRPGAFAVYLGLDGTDMKIGGYSMGAVAHVILHAGNYSGYAAATTGGNATGTWPIAISGVAASATVLQTARTINGVSFNGSANITVAAAAGTLTGANLASNVVISSLTSFGSGAQIVLADGSAATPSLRFAINGGSGIYYNPTGTIEFGANFNQVTRSVMRTYWSQPKVDFLIGTEVPLVLTDGSVEVFKNLRAVGLDIGASTARVANIYLTNPPNVSSDIRLKQVKGDIPDALDMVLNVKPFIFDWKDSQLKWDRPGFSAQEVEDYIDAKLGTRIVNTDINDMKSMYADNLLPILWQAVRELTWKVDSLLGN